MKEISRRKIFQKTILTILIISMTLSVSAQSANLASAFETKLTASDGDQEDYFGESVSIFGDHVIVGAYTDDDNGDDSNATQSDGT